MDKTGQADPTSTARPVGPRARRGNRSPAQSCKMDSRDMHRRCFRRDRRTQASVTIHPRLAADSGRIVANHDVPAGELKMALFNAPGEIRFSNPPMLLLAASTPSPGWRREFVEISHAGRMHVVQTALRKSVLGQAATALAESDETVEIVLYDADQWLVSCSDQDLELGENLALLGDEVIQFGEAIGLGAGRFRLARLLRGQAGTEFAIPGHSKEEPFVLVEPDTLQPITLPVWVEGSQVHASARNGSAECSRTSAFNGRSTWPKLRF